jgi:hypothetical protein
MPNLTMVVASALSVGKSIALKAVAMASPFQGTPVFRSQYAAKSVRSSMLEPRGEEGRK